ncbi:MAG: hypothetical protein Tsb0026_05110 [Sulfuricaulis sp.]
MTEPYIKNYQILGIQHGTSWKQLRKAYKSLVNTWHPDRFQQDSRKRKLAEEKTKEITQSYKELAEYYKKYGVLPLATKTVAGTATENSATTGIPDSVPAPERRDPDPAVVTTSAPAQKSPLSAFTVRAIAVVTLAGIAYTIWQLEASQHQDNPRVTVENANQATDASNVENPNLDTSASDKLFTLGSSLGEVYTIQGVPTRTEDDIWFYGKSKVYFSKGKVIRWDENSENPLRIKITGGTEKTIATFFGKGSSKEEVLAIQGSPDRDAGSVWDYGVSRVYFNNNRVTGWHETPLNPLKVRR